MEEREEEEEQEGEREVEKEEEAMTDEQLNSLTSDTCGSRPYIGKVFWIIGHAAGKRETSLRLFSTQQQSHRRSLKFCRPHSFCETFLLERIRERTHADKQSLFLFCYLALAQIGQFLNIDFVEF